MWSLKTGDVLWQVQLHWNIGPSVKNIWSFKTGCLLQQGSLKTGFTVVEGWGWGVMPGRVTPPWHLCLANFKYQGCFHCSKYSVTSLETTSLKDHLSWRATHFVFPGRKSHSTMQLNLSPKTNHHETIVFLANGAVFQDRFYCAKKGTEIQNSGVQIGHCETQFSSPISNPTVHRKCHNSQDTLE